MTMHLINKRTKREYEAAAIEILSLEAGSPLLAGSIMGSKANIVIPMGQEVDTYDFSTPQFSQEWDVTPGNS